MEEFIGIVVVLLFFTLVFKLFKGVVVYPGLHLSVGGGRCILQVLLG